ncbi:Antibiotic biosynthesis monooxygenase [Mycobacteroides abscessus]|uniref:antibiotic biosynthesis monooxygenase family protein n=1 Tax=Mycobacteroides abscessus TaxID=36809 RepID=UPI0005E2D0F4|nr:antibiotic biosynthesis monooxygenase [Mycobacteroides abscessus]CPT98187.1 Antibiotic biosynthesis monooxygenase [Mycobacteroides abscessus]CPX14501.1 Antibiotic biosynthesis monooxygenase [Mycobacteroides abscessus]CPZ99445.1 Antibiotic biosynthesis monooxygenase [Mycobacteroides abscessus]
MFEIKSLDGQFEVSDQLQGDHDGVVTFVAVHRVKLDDIPAFLNAWENEGPFLIKQPGFISRELVKSLGDKSETLIDYTKFDSLSALRDALFHPDHQALIAPYQELSGVSRQNVFVTT